jgi:hypothetical protein
MHRFMKIAIVLPAAALLAACVKQPSLEQKLAAAETPADREQTAYYECLKNAHYPVPGGHSNAYVGHEARQWAICDEMHKLNKAEN